MMARLLRDDCGACLVEFAVALSVVSALAIGAGAYAGPAIADYMALADQRTAAMATMLGDLCAALRQDPGADTSMCPEV